MAIVSSPLFSSIRNSLGNMVFYRINGHTYVRFKPLPRSKPSSPAQLRQQKRFAYMNHLARSFAPALLLGFPHFSLSLCLRTFVHQNKKAIQIDAQNHIFVDYPELRLSEGKLPHPLVDVEFDPNTNRLLFTEQRVFTLPYYSPETPIYGIVYSPRADEILVEELFSGGREASTVISVDTLSYHHLWVYVLLVDRLQKTTSQTLAFHFMKTE